MHAKVIRPVAVGLLEHEGRLLVTHGVESTTGAAFYRPPGGAVDFGERAGDALRREFLEELDAALSEPRLLGVLENLFEFEGKMRHEVVFVLEAYFLNPKLYGQAEFVPREPGRAAARWKPIEELLTGAVPLYPQGLARLLTTRPRRP
jgi:ADP-ribose pyrophosphatase YjhB (NUDIX family)